MLHAEDPIYTFGSFKRSCAIDRVGRSFRQSRQAISCDCTDRKNYDKFYRHRFGNLKDLIGVLTSREIAHA